MKLQGGGWKRTAIAAGLACSVTLGLAGCGVGHKGMLGQAAVIPHDGGTAPVGTSGGDAAPPASDAGSPASTGGVGASGRGGNGGGGASGRGGMSGHAGGGGISDASV